MTNKILAAVTTAAAVAVLVLAAPLAASAAPSYPPATTGTFSLTAHAGSNHYTVDGLDPSEEASGTISGSGALPTLAALHAAALTTDFGQTDASGSVSFALSFPAGAAGIYNISLQTPGGASASGSVTVLAADGSSTLPSTGSRISRAAIWAASVVVLVGVLLLLGRAAARRAERRQA